MSPQHGDRLLRQGDIAPAAFRLGRFEPEAGSRLLEGVLDAKHAGVEIDVGPLQREQLAAAQAGRKCEAGDRVQRVTLERVKDGGDLIGGKDLDLRRLTAGGLRMAATLRASVRSRRALEHEAQDAVSVADCPSR